MTTTSPRVLMIAGVLAGTLLVAGCQNNNSGSAAPAVPVAAASTAPAVSTAAPTSTAGPAATAAGSAATGSVAAYDPCKKLTKADVQPFFTVPIATELPSPGGNAEMAGCEWDGNDGHGGVPTSMNIIVYTGDTATTRWQLETASPGTVPKVAGVGDEAYHATGAPDLFARFGSGAALKICGITTIGSTHLVGKNQYPVAAIPESASATIAAQYGTLCNKIFGQGTTTPTMTAPEPTGVVTSSSGPAVAIPAVGGTVPGYKVPTPVGLDCSGSHTTPDNTIGQVVCDTTTTTPDAIYPFYLKELPAAGYTINHEQETHDNGKEVVSIGFSGPDIGLFSTITVVGNKVTIQLQKN